jgi:hypothetical protein
VEESPTAIVEAVPDDYSSLEVHTMLKPGDSAPNFSLPDGRKASELWANGPLAIFFFPQSFTPG